MFERFTAQGRDMVARAGREADALTHRQIGTEHLLLALTDPGAGPVAGVLADAAIDRERVRAEITRFAGSAADLLSEADAAALEAIGIDLGAVRAKLEESFGPGALSLAGPVEPPRHRWWRQHRGGRFTPRARKVLELAFREALRLGHGYVACEHVLLGLLRDGTGVGAKILADAGVDVAELRQQIEAGLRRAA